METHFNMLKSRGADICSDLYLPIALKLGKYKVGERTFLHFVTKDRDIQWKFVMELKKNCIVLTDDTKKTIHNFN